MRKVLFLFFVVFFCCTSNNETYFQILKGEWQVEEFYHKKEKLTSESYYLMGFEKNNHFWISEIDGSNEFISSDYKIYKNKESLKITLINCNEKRLEGVYDLYIDTLSNTKDQYMIQLTLDRENTYIRAIRSRNK